MLSQEPVRAILLKHIDTSAAGSNCQMRMGDLSGDGRLDFVLIQPEQSPDERYFPHSVKAATAYTSDGELLWQIGTPVYADVVCSTDIPAQIYDIDRDGYNEFLCVIDDFFCVYDGKTGELKRRTQLPDQYAYDCFAIADLEGIGYPRNIIIKNRYHQLWALDRNFNVLWTYKGNIGHFPLICDLNNDGKDEIIAGSVVLDSEGNVLWEFDYEDFPLSICVCDLNISKQLSVVTCGENNIVYNYDGTVKWDLKTNSKIRNLTAGNLRSDSFGFEIAGFFTEHPKSEFTDGVFITDYHCNTLFKEKRTDYISHANVSIIYDFDEIGTDRLLISEIQNSDICIYDDSMSPIYKVPNEGRIFWGDISGNHTTQILVYNDKSVKIYSARETDLSKSYSFGPRPQTKRLYNCTKYPYTIIEMPRYALGYAIGQFSKPDVRSWAQTCAAGEDETVMSRADFCIVLVEALGIVGYSNDMFFDTSKSDYFYNAVSTLKSFGYIDDIVGKFSPNGALTADFAISLVQKAADFIPLTSKSANDELTRRDAAKLILQIYQNRELK